MPTIQLPSGHTTIVDREGYALWSAFRWRLTTTTTTHPYAVTPVGFGACRELLYLHKFVLMAGKDTMVDHINGDTLDNRRENLRPCTSAENQRNRRPVGGRRFKGVSFSKVRELWIASIGFNGKDYNLGGYRTEEEAAKAYDAAAVKHFGEFAWLNFPRQPSKNFVIEVAI